MLNNSNKISFIVTVKVCLVTITYLSIVFNMQVADAQGNTWKLTGNSNVSEDDFIGSTNNAPFVFKANNTEMMRLNPNGSVDFADGVQLNLMGTANLDTIVSKYINTSSLFAAFSSINILNANNGTITNLQSVNLQSVIITSDTINASHLNVTTIENINVINTDVLTADQGTIDQLGTTNLETQNLKATSLSGSGTELVKVQNDGTFERFPLSNNTEEVLTGTGAFRLAPWTLNGNDITSSYSGNVGLGVTNPQFKLHVGGDIKYDGKLQNSVFETDPTTGTVSITGNLQTSGIIKSGNSVTIDGSGTIDQIWASTGKLSIKKNSNHEEEIKVGMGVNDPQKALHIKTTHIIGGGGGGSHSSHQGIRLENHVFNANGDPIGTVTATTWDIEPIVNQMPYLSFGTPGNPKMVIREDGKVGIGTTIPQSELAVNGRITAREVEVSVTGWPDYVFEDNYKLMSINELKSYLQQNKHLPNIPTAEEAHTSGIELAKMNKLLLEKVEELTLYVIQQQEEIEGLKKYVKKD